MTTRPDHPSAASAGRAAEASWRRSLASDRALPFGPEQEAQVVRALARTRPPAEVATPSTTRPTTPDPTTRARGVLRAAEWSRTRPDAVRPPTQVDILEALVTLASGPDA